MNINLCCNTAVEQILSSQSSFTSTQVRLTTSSTAGLEETGPEKDRLVLEATNIGLLDEVLLVGDLVSDSTEDVCTILAKALSVEDPLPDVVEDTDPVPERTEVGVLDKVLSVVDLLSDRANTISVTT